MGAPDRAGYFTNDLLISQASLKAINNNTYNNFTAQNIILVGKKNGYFQGFIHDFFIREGGNVDMKGCVGVCPTKIMIERAKKLVLINLYFINTFSTELQPNKSLWHISG